MSEHITPVVATRYVKGEHRDTIIAGHEIVTPESIMPLAKHGFKGLLDNALRVSEVQGRTSALAIPFQTLQAIDRLPETADEAVLEQRNETRRRIARHIAGVISFHHTQTEEGHTERFFDDDTVALLLDEQRSDLSDESRAYLLEYFVRKRVDAPAVLALHDVLAYRRSGRINTYVDLHQAFKDIEPSVFNRALRDELIYTHMVRCLTGKDDPQEGAMNALGFYSQHAGSAEYGEQIELLAYEALSRSLPDIKSLEELEMVFGIFDEPSEYVKSLKDGFIRDKIEKSLRAGNTTFAWALYSSRAGSLAHEDELRNLGERTVLAHAMQFLARDHEAAQTHRIIAFIDSNIPQMSEDNRERLAVIRSQIIAAYERFHKKEFVPEWNDRPKNQDDDTTVV